jgi:hypothetical protein
MNGANISINVQACPTPQMWLDCSNQVPPDCLLDENGNPLTDENGQYLQQD